MHASLLHLGHLHLPIFSAFAVVGLIVALLLSQRTAVLAGLAPEAMWDAGVVAALSVFVISRLLLVAFDFKSFLAYPMLILTLPSITFTGLLVSGVVVFVYLRFRRVSVIRVLDAAAPCVALLWAILSLGSFTTGSKGLPAGVPWAIEDGVLGPIHPVEVYAAVLFLCLAIGMFYALAVSSRREGTPGNVAATALFVAGFLLFVLDFFAQPSELGVLLWLDPVQWLGTLMIVVGVMMALPHLAPAAKPVTEETEVHAI